MGASSLCPIIRSEMNFKPRPVFRADTGCRGYHRRDPRFLPSRTIIYELRLPVAVYGTWFIVDIGLRCSFRTPFVKPARNR